MRRSLEAHPEQAGATDVLYPDARPAALAGLDSDDLLFFTMKLLDHSCGMLSGKYQKTLRVNSLPTSLCIDGCGPVALRGGVTQTGPAVPASGSGLFHLVLCQLIILGYSEVSFVRASSMVNCHLTPRCFWFVAVAQASISSRRSAMSSVRRPLRHCRVMQLNSFSAMFNQLPCLGV